jgi:galactose-1-phosphate uridylyltransferase
MPEFTNLNDVFQWWIENIYPDLEPEEKDTLKHFKYNFIKGRSLTKDKMFEILEKYGKLEISIKYSKE